MGDIRPGIPLESALFLAQKLGLKTFVEGGAFSGDTALAAAPHFSKVYTIEKSEVMYKIASEKLFGQSNIKLLKGDTREHIPSILKENDDFLFWLDAHWSGDNTYGEGDECPIMEELEMIFSSGRNFAILIDDARMFLAPPPLPHVAGSWPNMKKILSILTASFDSYIYEDVIYIFPVTIGTTFRDFLQTMVTVNLRQKSTPSGIIAKIVGKITSLILR